MTKPKRTIRFIPDTRHYIEGSGSQYGDSLTVNAYTPANPGTKQKPIPKHAALLPGFLITD